MKKVLFVAFMVMAFVAMGSLAVMACGGDKASTTNAKTASATTDKAACSATKASATTASAKSCSAEKASLASSKTTGDKACTAAEKAACAANASMASADGKCSIESCLKACEAKHAEICGEAAATHFMTAMSVKGMTCGGCESSVKTALMAVEGVSNVIDVCHKAGFAVVCTGKKDFQNESLVKAVTAKGFESEIIPAVAVTANETTSEKAECSAHKKDGAK